MFTTYLFFSYFIRPKRDAETSGFVPHYSSFLTFRCSRFPDGHVKNKLNNSQLTIIASYGFFVSLAFISNSSLRVILGKLYFLCSVN